MKGQRAGLPVFYRDTKRLQTVITIDLSPVYCDRLDCELCMSVLSISVCVNSGIILNRKGNEITFLLYNKKLPRGGSTMAV